MLQEALREIEEYCEKNSWLNEIHVFCKNWKEDAVKQWHGVAAFAIEVYYIYLLKLNDTFLLNLFLIYSNEIFKWIHAN